MTHVSVIIPAFNEERYIGPTLQSIHRARQYLAEKGASQVEILAVNNASTDHTARVAAAFGATVLDEPIHNIARVRNTGARHARGHVLVFIDADTTIPETLLWRIYQAMSDPSCAGGVVDSDCQPGRPCLRFYLKLCRTANQLVGSGQGATQFCRRDAYAWVGGYDETIYVCEDTDFHRRLKKQARRRGLRVCYIRDTRVIPSCRRFDQWPVWRTLLYTNPLLPFLFRHRSLFWRGWYLEAPR